MRDAAATSAKRAFRAPPRRWVQCQSCGEVWFLRSPYLSRQCIYCQRRQWLAPGDGAHTELPAGRLRARFYRCQQCGYVWTVREGAKLPRRCTNRACNSYHWQG